MSKLNSLNLVTAWDLPMDFDLVFPLAKISSPSTISYFYKGRRDWFNDFESTLSTLFISPARSLLFSNVSYAAMNSTRALYIAFFFVRSTFTKKVKGTKSKTFSFLFSQLSYILWNSRDFSVIAQ